MDYKDIKFPNMVDGKIDEKYIYGLNDNSYKASNICCVCLSSNVSDNTKIKLNFDLEYIDPITEFYKDNGSQQDFDLRSYPDSYEYSLCNNTEFPYYSEAEAPQVNTVKYEFSATGLYKKFGIHITGLESSNGTSVGSITPAPTIYLRLPEFTTIEARCDSDGKLLSGIKIFNDSGIEMNVDLVIPYGVYNINKNIIGNNLNMGYLIFESDNCDYTYIREQLGYDEENIKFLIVG